MQITATMVKELRDATGAGMMDCKKALTETQGDIQKAIDYLREKGLAAAAKKASRIAAEGLVAAHLCAECGLGALVEVNCETDFVAKTDEFKELVDDIALQIAKDNPADVDALLASAFHKDEGMTVAELITAKVAKIGEKITVRRFVRYATEGAFIDAYIHMGGKVGVLVEMAAPAIDENLKEATHDIALQIAAASPVAPEYVHRAQVDPAQLEHEKEILIAQARNEGKPEKVIERMVEGRIVKFYRDVCLLEQPFVKDADISVETMLKHKAEGAEIVRFTRYKMGEGLEKRLNDLAAEVAAQTGGAK